MLILLLSLCPLGAVADPTWYDIQFLEINDPPNLFNNSITLEKDEQIYDLNFARILSGMQIVPLDNDDINLKVKIVAPYNNNNFIFKKISDQSKIIEFSLVMIHETTSYDINHLAPSLLYQIQAAGLGAEKSITNFYMDIEGHWNQGKPWRGTYYCPLIIQIFDRSGNTLLGEWTYNLLLHFMESSIGGGTTNPLTLLTIDQRYPIADNIPMTSASPIKVATITFLSNEAKDKYGLHIAPGGSDSSFQFNHTNPSTGNNNSIGYKVRNPETGIYLNLPFSFQFLYSGSSENWNSNIDIYIDNINYTLSNPRAGTYQSTIVIVLENNF